MNIKNIIGGDWLQNSIFSLHKKYSYHNLYIEKSFQSIFQEVFSKFLLQSVFFFKLIHLKNSYIFKQ